MRINPLLWFLYHFLRGLFWIGLHGYYRRILVLGRNHLRTFNGPVIVIVNHPNTLIDVLGPGVYIPRVLYFLANYGLFKNPVVGAILRTLYCIPVKRKEDVEDGEDRNNDAAFEQCFKHLEKGGALFIAPEGVSWMNRFVRPFKTGTARIALGLEARQHWQAGLKIIPVGLSYPAPDRFRSDMVISVGAPVLAAEWQNAWNNNPVQAAEDLTQYLENQLKTLTIHTVDEPGEVLITRLETILNNSHPLPQKAGFERSQQLTTLIGASGLQTETAAYFEALQQYKCTDQGIAALAQPAASFRTFREAFVLTLGFPFCTLGLAFWYLPCIIPGFIAKKLNLYIGYTTTVRLIIGVLITVPLAFWGLWRLIGPWLPNGWWFGAVAAIMVVLGLVTEQYLAVAKRFTDRMQAASLKTAVREQLLAQRRVIGEKVRE